MEEEIQQRHAKTPDICFGIIMTSPAHLGGHVAYCALEATGHGAIVGEELYVSEIG